MDQNTFMKIPDLDQEVEVPQVSTKPRRDSLKQVIRIISLYPHHSLPQACTSKCQERTPSFVILPFSGKKKSGARIHRTAQETGFSVTSFGALKELELFGFLGTAENKESMSSCGGGAGEGEGWTKQASLNKKLCTRAHRNCILP